VEGKGEAIPQMRQFTLSRRRDVWRTVLSILIRAKIMLFSSELHADKMLGRLS